ncbi:MAG: microcin C ABC transporter permease YejB [Rickettsiales bacterium]|nr:microcin C ABC transporter permease YejB [Pseudomonadota bacterium]MDA0965512.1 microcin C ABC transporter permease YejB [Pseudomonadota bacterium]MDG4542836.1 microcin C ABC transporter permease YejB [Rickettsiales bacterium]MDG4544716.1 microcin C ABC transporter permease YejB [Rickettsiales bacterium]MDG4546838.1 microcin C ABC transporter permease YejB [Rickettsiales bacterium]
MFNYILKRLLLMIPTLLGIVLINFIIVHVAPGGPVEQMIAQVTHTGVDATARFTGNMGDMPNAGNANKNLASGGSSKYRGAQGLDPDLIKEIEKLYGFDKPIHIRFFDMLKNYAVFDFGDSFFKDKKVIELVIDKMPVSISLGLWTTLLVYLISIPLGIRKAVRDGSNFDIWTSTLVSIGYAIPGFLFAIILIVFFAGGSYWQIFPLRGLTSPGWESFSAWQKVYDYFWHIALPVLAMVISGFAGLTMLTKNSFLEEIGKQYVITARAKGLSEKRVLYGHVFRNAMLIVVAGFPSAFIGILFTGSLLIETIFSLDGLGLLGFEAVVSRDYPVIFGTLFFFTIIGLVLNLVGDLTYRLIDPRIDFERRDV